MCKALLLLLLLLLEQPLLLLLLLQQLLLAELLEGVDLHRSEHASVGRNQHVLKWQRQRRQGREGEVQG